MQRMMLALGVLALLAPCATCDEPPLFVEQDGVVIVEIEAVDPTGLWKEETDLKGFTGRCYYTWTGKGINKSGRAGELVYTIRIITPGTYQFRIRNRHDFEDSTEENDCFTRMDDGKPTKTFSSRRGEWTWATNHEHSHGQKPNASYDLAAGEHTFTISGRSGGFSIDRFVFYLDGREKEATDMSREATTGLPSLPKLEHLSRVASYVEKRKLGYALKSAERAMDDSDPASAEEAKAVVACLTAHAKSQKSTLEKLIKTHPLAAVEGMEVLAELYSGSDIGQNLKDLAREWSRDPSVKRAEDARDVLAKIEKYVTRIRDSGVDPAHPAYRKRFKKDFQRIDSYMEELEADYADTQACKQGRFLVETLPRN